MSVPPGIDKLSGKSPGKRKAAAVASRSRPGRTPQNSTSASRPGKSRTPAARRDLAWQSCLAAVVVVAAVAVYANTLSNGFILDDNDQILANPWIRDPRFLGEVFSRGVWGFMPGDPTPYYRPIMHALNMVTYRFSGLAPWGFHLVNVLFHAANALLALLVAAKLFETATWQQDSPPQATIGRLLWPPFVTALLFAVHPINTEAVNWAAALPELSFTSFFLLSFYFFLPGSARQSWGPVLSSAAFFIALLCKETALTLPILLVAYDYLWMPRDTRLAERIKRYLPYCGVVAVYLLLRFRALGTSGQPLLFEDANLYQHIIDLPVMFVGYLHELLWPVHLTAFPGKRPLTAGLGLEAIGSLLLAAGYLACIVITAGRNRLVALALMLVAIPLLPTFYLATFSPVPFNERYLYLPSLGFGLLLGTAAARCRTNGPTAVRAAVAALCVLVVVFSALGIQRNRTWKNESVLFSDTLRKSPQSELAHGFLGNELLDRGEVDAAIGHFQAIADKINPRSTLAHYNLGRALKMKGSKIEAIAAFERALTLGPSDPDTHLLLAWTYAESAMLDQAVAHYSQATAVDAQTVDAYLGLGAYLEKKGAVAAAIATFQRALAVHPESTLSIVRLELAYAKAGLFREAIAYFEALAAAQPANAMVRNILGVAYAHNGAYDAAIEQFEAAITMDPAAAPFRKNLENARGMKTRTATPSGALQ